VDFSAVLQNGLESIVGLSACYFALLAIGLNVHFGYTGLLNFGQVGFMAVGSYGLAISISKYDVPLAVGVLVSLAAAVLLALLLGIPTLRLRADYLAITTIAAAEILRLALRSVTLGDLTGGSAGIPSENLPSFSEGFRGLNPFPPGTYEFGIVSFSANELWILTVGWSLVALSALLVWLLVRSPWGRVLKAIREDEDAARALGKNVFLYKMQSLVLGGVIGALGGIVYALGTGSVQPDNYSSAITFFAYTALLLGGAARVLGPVIGSMIFWFVLSVSDTLLRQLVENGYVPSALLSGSQVGQVRFMLVGLGLALLMVFRPQGIFGDRREIALDAR